MPFLQFDAEIRRIVCTTNAIESVNARIRKAVRARGHFPTENAALKCIYLAVMSLDPTGTGRKRWTTRWKRALQAFDRQPVLRTGLVRCWPGRWRRTRASTLCRPAARKRPGIAPGRAVVGPLISVSNGTPRAR